MTEPEDLGDKHSFYKSLFEMYYLPAERRAALENILLAKGIAGEIADPSSLEDASSIDYIAAGTAAHIIDVSSKIWSPSERIYVAYVLKDETINAFAADIGDSKLIVIFSGLVLKMMKISLLITSTIKGRHIIGLPLDRNIKLTVENYRELSREDGIPVLSNIDVEHRNISLVLSMIGVIVYHEIGHIINGHIGLLNSYRLSGNNPALDRVSFTNTRQTLEYDADTVAAVGWIGFVGYQRAINKGRINGYFKEFLSHENWIKFSAFSVFCCFIYDGIVFRVDDVWVEEPSAHPSADLRAWASYLTICEWMVQREGFTYEEASKLISPVHIAAVEISCLICDLSIPENRSQWLELFSSRFSKYMDRINGRWAKIRPDLEKYKIGTVGNLAISQCDPS